MGIVSSIGNNVQEVTSSLHDARSGITLAETYRDMGFRCQVHGSLKVNVEDSVDRRARRFMGEGAAYNFLAMEQALADSGLEEKDIVNPRTPTKGVDALVKILIEELQNQKIIQ